MDAQSVITQVTRDDENANNNTNSRPDHKIKTVPETKTAPGKSSSSSHGGGLFSRLFCCFSRPAITQSTNTSSSASSALANLSNSFKKSDNNNVNFILAPVAEAYKDKKCVVIDLDETLVHSSFQPVKNADFIIPVEIDGTIHQVYILKRPYVDEFLKKMGELFECILFTASLGKYADPVTDLLDKWNVFQARLFRESCVFHRGNYVKDLSRLGRDLNGVVIIDNSPMSYLFHPKNAVPVTSWFDDPTDRELLNLIPFFENLATTKDSVYTFLNQSRQSAAFNSASVTRTIEAVSLVSQQVTLTNHQATFHPTSNQEIAPLNDTFSPAPVVVVVDDADVVAATAGLNVSDGVEIVAVVCNGDAVSKQCNDSVDSVELHQLHKGDGDQLQPQQQIKLQQPQIKVQSAEQLKQQQQQELQQNKAILRQNQQQQHSLPQPVRVTMQQQQQQQQQQRSSLQHTFATTFDENVQQKRSSSLNRQHLNNNINNDNDSNIINNVFKNDSNNKSYGSNNSKNSINNNNSSSNNTTRHSQLPNNHIAGIKSSVLLQQQQQPPQQRQQQKHQQAQQKSSTNHQQQQKLQRSSSTSSQQQQQLYISLHQHSSNQIPQQRHNKQPTTSTTAT